MLGILGELDRAGLLNRNVKNVLGLTLPQTLEQYDITVTQDEAVKKCSVLALPVSVLLRRFAGLSLGFAG